MLTARAAAALVAAAVPSSGAFLAAPASQRTHPHVRPATGGRRTTFTVAFTLRSTAGHTGLLATTYRIDVGAVRHLAARCLPPQPAVIESGAVGSIDRVALTSPSGGWCRGRYAARVFLQRGPYCPPPAAYGMPVPCPEFATQELSTGTARFRVR
jgi:hypothetical protein